MLDGTEISIRQPPEEEPPPPFPTQRKGMLQSTRFGSIWCPWRATSTSASATGMETQKRGKGQGGAWPWNVDISKFSTNQGVALCRRVTSSPIQGVAFLFFVFFFFKEI